jgi:xylulokinase
VWASPAETVEPNREYRDVYDRLYTIYGELYPATKSQAHALAALQAEEGLVPTPS